MKITIFGAGAIGGYLGAMLSRTNADVSLIARGDHLKVIQNRGLQLELDGESFITHPRATQNTRELGVQDYVIITMKAHSVVSAVEDIQPLLGPNTTVITAVNGVPWWYFYSLAGEWENRRLESVDPNGAQWTSIGPERVIGCVVYPACELIAPGIVRHLSGNRFSLGEPSGEKTDRLQTIANLFSQAGLRAPLRKIRDEIWLKLWGNLCFNPLSALTGATLDVVATQNETKAVARNMMLEAQAIGEKLGVRFAVDVDKRIDGAAAVGAHVTSMLQDLRSGRTMEIDALITVVQELGVLTQMPTPTIDTILPLVQQRASLAGCYE